MGNAYDLGRECGMAGPGDIMSSWMAGFLRQEDEQAVRLEPDMWAEGFFDAMRDKGDSAADIAAERLNWTKIRGDSTYAFTGPDRINGYRVVASSAIFGCKGSTRDGRVILAQNEKEPQKMVIACQYRGRQARDGGPWDNAWYHGDYRNHDIPGAWRAFVIRAEKHNPALRDG